MKDKGINKVNEENTIGLNSDEYKTTSLYTLL
jgi:hypothetical protein